MEKEQSSPQAELDLIDRAKHFAIERHEAVSHLYDGGPYAVHLDMAVHFFNRYITSLDEDDQIRKHQHVITAAIWLHDTIEDCRLTYNDIKQEFGLEVAELVYAVTNEKGRTRAERANYDYYEGIQKTKFATIIKLCDKLANVTYSLGTGSSMFDKYKKEHEFFKDMLYDKSAQEGAHEDLWMKLHLLLND